MDITPITTREEFVKAAADAGIRRPFNDTRCLNEYKSYSAGNPPYDDGAYYRAMIARGAALHAQGWTPPASCSSGPSRRRSTYAERAMTALTGLPSGSGSGDCHECGQAKRALGTHAWYAHQITADDYRARHGLSVGQGLAAPVTAAKFSDNGRSEAALRALAENRDPDRARAANRPGPLRAQSLAIKQAIGRRARLGRPLTPQEVERLVCAESIAAWAAIAWELLGGGASRGSIARGTAIPLAAVHQRVTRYRPKT